MLYEPGDLNSCPLAYAISTFNSKWKPFIIWYISISENETIRYGKLHAAIPHQISCKMLTEHLRELELDGIIRRTCYDSSIKHVEYSLTEKGRSLATILYLLRDWGAFWGDFDSEVLSRTRGYEYKSGIVYLPPNNTAEDGPGLAHAAKPISLRNALAWFPTQNKNTENSAAEKKPA